MKIALFYNFPYGGAKRALYYHCQFLHTRGCLIDLYTLENRETGPASLEPFVRRRVTNPAPGSRGSLGRFLFASRFHRRFAWLINRGDYDVALLETCAEVGAPLLAKYLEIPSVYFCQEPLYSRVSEMTRLSDVSLSGGTSHWAWLLWLKFLRLSERRTARDFLRTRILVNSHHSRQDLLETWGVTSHVSYLGVDTSVFVPVPCQKENAVISVGALSFMKGHRFLLRALGRIDARARPKLIVVANFAESRERIFLEQLARDCGVQWELHIGIEDRDLVRHYSRARLAAACSHREPFGLFPLEAMACGLPVVAVREGGFLETVEDGVTGRLVARDPEAFGRALEELLEDPALAARLGKKGRQRVERDWTWDRAGERLLGHLKDVTAMRRTSRPAGEPSADQRGTTSAQKVW